MIGTFYTLAAVARALDARLAGTVLADAYTQHRDELRLVFDTPDGPETVAVALRPPAVWVDERAVRARRNTADVLPDAVGRTVRGVRVADLDRHVFVDLDDGAALDLALFGPRPNVLLVHGETVDDAFLAPAAFVGTSAPMPRPARLPNRPDELGPRFFPTFDATMAAEASFRATATGTPLLDAAEALHREALASDTAWLYDNDAGHAEAFSLVPLRHLGGRQETRFENVLDALRVFARRRRTDAAVARKRARLAERLEAATADRAARAERLLDALAQPSRADAHEAEGHLLMASLHAVPPGASSVTLAGFDGTTHTLALDPALSAVQNAHARYDRARRVRAARAVAEARLDDAVRDADAARALRDRLANATTPEALAAVEIDAAPLLREAAPTSRDERLPYHRVDLGFGYEAWIGRSAKDNDALTLRHARPYDLWLHARGVAGSHVLIRVKGRTDVPPGPVIERAARLAAFHSKAKTSALVPVVVTPRKWVRKAKGSPPGQVLVEREAEVRIVPPEAP